MTLLKVNKRSPSAINIAADWNPSVFRYYVDEIEVKTEAMRDGLIPPFLAMLNELIRPDPRNQDIDGNWSFSTPISSNGGLGGTTQIINNYNDVKYIYRAATQTIRTAAIPAKLNGYTGRLFSGVQHPMTGQWIYTQVTSLLEAVYGELFDPGYPPEIVDLEVVGAEPRIKETYNFTAAGYFPVQMGETPTHGKDGFAFRPLSFWDEVITTPGDAEYTGILTEGVSGFTLDTSKICFNTTDNGNALNRYNPIDLITFAELIKLQYQYRESATMTGEI